MNKDAIFATLIGLGIGLLLTGIIIVGPNIVKSMPKVTLPSINLSFLKKQPTPTPASNAAAQPKHEVTIDSPLSDAIEGTESVLVSGSTSRESKVIIQGIVDDVVIMTNGEGKFAGKVTLTEGKNDILVTSYHAEGISAIQKVTVYYTPEVW